MDIAIAESKAEYYLQRLAPAPEKRKRERPKMYGEIIALGKLFDSGAFQQAPSAVYGEKMLPSSIFA